MAEAKEAAKRKAAEIRQRHRDEEKASPGGGAGGFGSQSSGRYMSSGGGSDVNDYSRPIARSPVASAVESSSSSASASSSSSAAAGGRKGGMKLGSKKGPGAGAGGSGMASVMAEEGLKHDVTELAAEAAVPAAALSGAAAAVSAATAAAAAASSDHASVTIEDRLTAKLTRDGGIESIEIKGMLSLAVADEAHARLRMATAKGPGSEKFAFTTHPNVNKAAFTSDGTIALKQPDRPFPVGAPLGVLRWRYAGSDEATLPLALTVWPEEGPGGSINVNIEYSLTAEEMTLTDVTVTVPLPHDATPKVAHCDGTHKHNTRENHLTWHIDVISADNGSGTLEFSVKGRDTDVFFPVTVGFSSGDLLCPIAVGEVTGLGGEAEGKPLRYSVVKNTVVEAYTIG